MPIFTSSLFFLSWKTVDRSSAADQHAAAATPADDPDPSGVDLVIGGVVANEPHGGLRIVDGRRVRVVGHEAVVDAENRVAVIGEELGHATHERLVSLEESAAVDRDERGERPAAPGKEDVHEEVDPGCGPVLDVVLDAGFIARGDQRRGPRRRSDQGEHRSGEAREHAPRRRAGHPSHPKSRPRNSYRRWLWGRKYSTSRSRVPGAISPELKALKVSY